MARPTKKLQPTGGAARKSGTRTPMTHEGIAADIEAFRGAGGKIEVLGVTRTLLRIDTAEAETPQQPTPTPTKEK